MNYDIAIIVASFSICALALFVLGILEARRRIILYGRQIHDLQSDLKHWKDYTRGEVRRLDKDQSSLALELSKQRWERRQKR